MKLTLSILLLIASLNAWSHCGGCGMGGNEDHSHATSKDSEVKKETADQTDQQKADEEEEQGSSEE